MDEEIIKSAQTEDFMRSNHIFGKATGHAIQSPRKRNQMSDTMTRKEALTALIEQETSAGQ